MQNPFTTTFSKVPGYSYIYTEQEQAIIDNFSFDDPSESLYKITGVRGSGKTVMLARVEEEFSSAGRADEGWIVYRLTPNRDMIRQLASYLYKESFVKKRYKARSVNISANILGSGGGIGVSGTEEDGFFDLGVEVSEMLEAAYESKKKILIGIDEVLKNHEMMAFALEFGKWLRAGYPVYVLCTGLYENIEQLYNVKNLTFFRRASTIKTEPLNMVRMAEMYKNRLDIDIDTAKTLAKTTKGYPYAFQELGVLCFRDIKKKAIEDIIPQLKSELFAYSYEKIWEELTQEDRKLVMLLLDKDEYKREEVIGRMEKPGNYSPYRDRLLKRGILSSRQGYISLALPFFNEYVKEYCI